MEILKGIPVSPGIAIAQAFLLDTEGVRIPEHFISEDRVEEELNRLNHAFDEVRDELEDFAHQVSEKAGSSVAEIFLAHAGILGDERFCDEVREKIRDKRYTAEFAVARTMRHWRRFFQQEPESVLASRVADLDDLEKRLLRRLLGEKKEELGSLHSEVVLIAHDLGPSETASVDPTQVKGFAIDAGGPTSHTAIIARALGLPAVVGLETLTNELSGGDMVIVDGERGVVIVAPDEQTLETYRQKRDEEQKTDQVLTEELRHLPAETTDGHRISLMANIDSPQGIEGAVSHGAEGIGLYRTEYLYLTSDTPPNEHQHFEAYMDALRQLGDRPLIIRTLDLGADKFVRGMGMERENNPFLGLRSIRYCLEHPGLLRTQLKAILRASAYGNVKVMFPLVSTIGELNQTLDILEELQQDFAERGEEYDRDMEVGIMIEVPSAAICADCLANKVDFFSIGTNDLIQYTLAIDRANEHVAHLYRPSHPSVLRLMKMTVEAGRRHGVNVSLCGEMASEVIYTILLTGLGIDHLSVAPAALLPEIKNVIRKVSFEDAQKAAEDILSCEDPEEAFNKVQEYNRKLVPDIFPVEERD